MCVCALAIASRVWRGINGAYVSPPFKYTSAPLLDFIQRQSMSIFVGERARRYVCDGTYCAVRRFKHDMCSHYRSIHKHKFSLTLSFSNHSQREREREREAVLGCIVWRLKLDVCTHYRFIHALFLSLTHMLRSLCTYESMRDKKRERESEQAMSTQIQGMIISFDISTFFQHTKNWRQLRTSDGGQIQ